MKIKRTSLEILLSLKRNEMPSEGFWDTFDQQLAARLEKCAVPEKLNLWQRFLVLLQPLKPAMAACLFVLLFVVGKFSSTEPKRFEAVLATNSIQSCQLSTLSNTVSDSRLPLKNVIQKKNVASMATNCFSF